MTKGTYGKIPQKGLQEFWGLPPPPRRYMTRSIQAEEVRNVSTDQIGLEDRKKREGPTQQSIKDWVWSGMRISTECPGKFSTK
eukprot:11327257-Ditylum_brightwellii.AAC.1